jgi:hypothetical protein
MNSYDYYTAADPDSYGDDENYDADRSYIGEGSNGVNHNSQSVQANWMPYIIIGGVLTTLMLGIVWRKRVSETSLLDDNCSQVHLTHMNIAFFF